MLRKKALLCICLFDKIRTGETEVFTMPGTTKKAVRIMYDLETPIREDLYDYFVNH